MSTALPPIPPRGVLRSDPQPVMAAGTVAPPAAVPPGMDDDVVVDPEKDIMCAQVAELVIKKETDRLELARLRALVSTYQQHIGEDPNSPSATGELSGQPLTASPQKRIGSSQTPSVKKERVSSAGPSSPRRRVDAAGGTALALVASSSEALASSLSTSLPPEDALMVAQLQLLRLQTQNDALISASDAVRDECRQLSAAFEEKLLAAQRAAMLQAKKIEDLTEQQHKLNSRVADDILLQSQRNRIEMAARRMTAPKVARLSGLRRIEACERNALAAHDDLYYIRRDLSMQVPTHKVTLVLQTFHGVDALRAMAPGLVDFLLSTYRATLASHASKRGGYHVCEWDSFSCYAFRSPSSALAFAAACHVELTHFEWPDTIVHCKAFSPEYAKSDETPAPAPTSTPAGRRLGGDEELKRGPLVFNGPRLHSYLSFGNPCCEVDARTGRLLYYGHDVNVAVSALAYLVRPGEICANVAWADALIAETQPTPPTPPAAAAAAVVLPEQSTAVVLLPTETAVTSPPTPLASTASKSPMVTLASARGSTFLASSGNNNNGGGDPQVLLSLPRGASNLSQSLRESKDANLLDVLRPNGYQQSELRRGFPRINVITQTEPMQRGAYSRSPPALPSWFYVSELVSIVPDALAARRKHALPSKIDPSWTTTSLASSDTLMTFVLLTNRSLNGRACGPGSISDEMKLWVAKAVRLSIAQAASSPALSTLSHLPHGSSHHNHSHQSTVGRPGSSDITTLVPPAAAPSNVGSAAGGPSPSKNQRRSVQSDGPQRHRAPSIHAGIEATEQGGGVAQPRTRRASKSSAHLDTTQSPTATIGTTSSHTSQQHLSASSPNASNNHLAASTVPLLSIPFPPLLDVAPRGSTVAVSKTEAKRFFTGYVFQRQAQAFELAAMEREDAFLAAKHQPLTPLHPPSAFVTVDVANIRTFDGSNDVAVARFAAPFQKMLRISAGLHHAFLIGSNGEDVHLYAFRNVEDALKFTATIHLRFYKDGFLDYLAGSWLPPAPLSLDATTSATPTVPFASIVNLRCGVSYGSPAVVASRVSPTIHTAGRDGGVTPVPLETVHTDCSGPVVRKSGYLCAAAAPGETLATSLTVKAFYGASKKNLTSLELTMVHKGLRIVEGNAGCPMSLYSVQNAALVRSSQVFGRTGRSGSRHQSVLTIGSQHSGNSPQSGSPSSISNPLQAGGGAGQVTGSHNSQWFGDIRAPVQVGSMLFDVTSVSSIVFTPMPGGAGAGIISPQQSPLVETVGSLDLEKIIHVVDTNRRLAFPLFSSHAGHQRLLRRSVAAMYRQQIAECALMSMHDPLAGDSTFQSAPSARGELAVLYTDVEGSLKLLEAAGEAFCRAQQHYNWVVRELVHQYDGYVTHTNGYESWVVVFSSLRQAMEVAIALQQQLLTVDWSGDIVKHERALRVRDPKTGSLVFSGLRARVGISVGFLTQQQSGGYRDRFDYSGSVVDDTVRIGRSCPGGDIWLSPDAIRMLEQLNEHINPVISGSHRRLTAQVRLRPILQPTLEDPNTPLAVSCVLRTMEARVAKFPQSAALLDRVNRITSSMEKDLGTWWRQAATLGMRNESVRMMISKKKSMTGSTMLSAMGATLGVNTDGALRSPSISAAAGATPAVAMLMDRLIRIERQLPPSSSSGGGNNAGSGSSTPRGKQLNQQAAPSNASVTVGALSQVIRGAIGCLRGGSDMAAAVKMLEDASRLLGAADSFESKTPPPSVLKPSPPPPNRGVINISRGRGGRK